MSTRDTLFEVDKDTPAELLDIILQYSSPTYPNNEVLIQTLPMDRDKLADLRDLVRSINEEYYDILDDKIDFSTIKKIMKKFLYDIDDKLMTLEEFSELTEQLEDDIEDMLNDLIVNPYSTDDHRFNKIASKNSKIVNKIVKKVIKIVKSCIKYI